MIQRSARVFHAFDIWRRVYNVDDKVLVLDGGDAANSVGERFGIAADATVLPNAWPTGDATLNWAEGDSLPQTVNTTVTRHYVPHIIKESTINYPTILAANIYANNIFTHSVLHDIYVNTVGYTLIRIHKTQQ